MSTSACRTMLGSESRVRRVAQGDGGLGVDQHRRHRPAEDRAAADDRGVGPVELERCTRVAGA